MKPTELHHLRKEIDQINKEIYVLILKRLAILDKIFSVKRQLGIPLHAPRRRNSMAKKLRKVPAGKRHAQFAQKILNSIFDHSLQYLESRKVP